MQHRASPNNSAFPKILVDNVVRGTYTVDCARNHAWTALRNAVVGHGKHSPDTIWESVTDPSGAVLAQ